MGCEYERLDDRWTRINVLSPADLPPATATPAELDRHVLAVEEGPGTLELWSPDCAILWRVAQAEFSAGERTTWHETGPASRVFVPVGNMGARAIAERVIYVVSPGATVNPRDGRIEPTGGGAPTYRAGARFLSGHVFREGIGVSSVPLACLAPDTITINLEIPGGGSRTIGYPPQDRTIAHLIGSNSLIAAIVTGDPGKVAATLISPPALIHAYNVSPLAWLRLTNPNAAPVELTLTWRRATAVSEV